jgi:hypothetical protein
MSAIGPKRTSLAAPHMSAFGDKADIFVILSTISLRQCRSMRRRIAKPSFCRGPSIGSDALVALLDEFQDIIQADVLNFVKRRCNALTFVRHGLKSTRVGFQANAAEKLAPDWHRTSKNSGPLPRTPQTAPATVSRAREGLQFVSPPLARAASPLRNGRFVGAFCVCIDDASSECRIGDPYRHGTAARRSVDHGVRGRTWAAQRRAPGHARASRRFRPRRRSARSASARTGCSRFRWASIC